MIWYGTPFFIEESLMAKPKRVAIYLRVSTVEQDIESQRLALLQVAERAGWDVVEVYADKGISGSKGRTQRPAFDAMLKAVTQRKVDMVAAWSVDRLGRSLQHLVETLNDLKSAGADLYLHQQAIDTTTSSGRAMFGMLGVFAEFEREIIRERVKAGLAKARAKGKTIGRPLACEDTVARIRELRSKGIGIRKVARELGCGVSLVQRVEAGTWQGLPPRILSAATERGVPCDPARRRCTPSLPA
jgi:DNA invertase Pin-like site-specific DNA recombinase